MKNEKYMDGFILGFLIGGVVALIIVELLKNGIL
jgi:hypothetical protein